MPAIDMDTDINRTVDYGAYGRPVLAYVEYVHDDRVQAELFSFRDGHARPGQMGAHQPTPMVTFEGAGPLDGLAAVAQGSGGGVRLADGVFAHLNAWGGRTGELGRRTNRIAQVAGKLTVNLLDRVQLRVSSRYAHETHGFLGALGNGAFATESGSTITMAGVAARYRQPTATGTFDAFARYNTGSARFGNPESVLQAVDARLEYAAAGLNWQDTAGVNAVSFTVSQPLTVTGGDMDLRLASGRTDDGQVLYRTPTVAIDRARPQVSFEVGITHRFNETTRAGVNLVYIKNPAEAPREDSVGGALASVATRW